MIAPLAKLMDWSVLQINSLHRSPFSGQSLGLEKALEALDGPNFIPAESRPAKIEFDGPLQFHFQAHAQRYCRKTTSYIADSIVA